MKKECFDDTTSSMLIDGIKRENDLSSINQFPDEILLKIFSKLSFGDKFKSARVCKRWNHLVYDKSCWKKLAFVDWQTSKTFAFIYWLIQNCFRHLIFRIL